MRSLILLIDSFGAGALPDAGEYGDEGSNTLLHICQSHPGGKWPNLRRLGLGNAAGLLQVEPPGLEAISNPLANYALLKESSPGKDTTTGHWELLGITLDKAFHQFPKEFPSFDEKLISSFLEKSECQGILGNKAASGTEIINELGEEHLKTGYPICYTSADSVFQIAAHVDVIPLESLYQLCQVARQLCDPLNVGRVIARPFTGTPGHFTRTKDRKDFSLPMPAKSLWDHLADGGIETVGIGKTGSIFNEQGIQRSFHDKGNENCLDRSIEILKEAKDRQFIFTNLVDTDMIYGHRRDPEGYYQAVDEIDSRLGEIIDLLKEGDNLIITADHGCDPCFKGSDHTREFVPLLFYRKGQEKGKSLGIRESFSDLAKTLLELYSVKGELPGKSMAAHLV